MNQAKPVALGFLTVLVTDEQGLIGGYLVLNQTGRPLEFHCTAPVKPNRAQQILFGPTLEPYLYGEQIGQTLLAKGSAEPVTVFTDVAPALMVRDFVDIPVALVLCESSEERQFGPAALTSFTLLHQRLAVVDRRRSDQDAILSRLGSLELFDLTEPFVRIREAIEEARRQSRAA